MSVYFENGGYKMSWINERKLKILMILHPWHVNTLRTLVKFTIFLILMLKFLFFDVEIKLFIFFTSGTFKPKQLLDVIGHVADNQNPTISHLQVIHTYPILFCGSSDPIPVDRKARFNPGEKLIEDLHFIKFCCAFIYIGLISCSSWIHNYKGQEFKYTCLIMQ